MPSRSATTSTAAKKSTRCSKASRTSSSRPTCRPNRSAAIGRSSKPATACPSAIACLLGRLFMKPVDSPWHAADRVLAAMPADVRVRFVDFHAEATSDMQLMGRYLDGRVTAVLGTHTHVPTADECIFPGGTAFQCDVGMTGPFDSIIGRRIDRVLETTLTGRPTEFDVATGDVRLCGTIVTADPETGRATAIERLCVTEADLPRLQRRKVRRNLRLCYAAFSVFPRESVENA